MKGMRQNLRVFRNYLKCLRVESWQKYSYSTSGPCAITYAEYGVPSKVLRRSEIPLPKSLAADEISVRMMAAPVNPADINMIQGSYPVKPNLPAVGGNEGVGEVVSVGAEVSAVKPGDWVVPNCSGCGTWKTHAQGPASDFLKIPNDIPLISAATITVNPCTAYRMLSDFVDLTAGDVVLQNGANSGVGQAVIQIAAAKGLKTVNVIRDRPDIDKLITHLKSIGATHVVTEEMLRKPAMKELLKNEGLPKIAFNCVGGKSTTDLMRLLDHKGSLVTYGGMSKQPVIVPTSSLIFKDLRIVGYWMTRWNTENLGSPERFQMLNELCDMMRNGQLQPPPSNQVNINNFQEAIFGAMEPLATQKQILVMD